MRVLKSGEIRFKASAHKEASRLQGSPLPMSLYPRGTRVQVYMAGGWALGSVDNSTKEKCSVFLAKQQRMVSCTDNRNLRKHSET
jgi:hypothetical protein